MKDGWGRYFFILALVLASSGCRKPGAGTPAAAAVPANAPVARPALHYTAATVGEPASGRPIIAHVLIADLDADGMPDILACDAVSHSVRWLRQQPRGTFVEHQIGSTVRSPVHCAVADLDGDGRQDVLVASMGVITPNNDRIGSVVWLRNLGEGQFENVVIESNLTRVTDVRPVDVNGDGRLDLVLGQFGYFEGEIAWLENLGAQKFQRHTLLQTPGTIHTPVADFDRDGRPDFAALVSQDAEEVRVFYNRGRGSFEASTLWKSLNPAWASSGIEVGDVNRDGRPDILYTNGDGFDGQVNAATWHGLQWLESSETGFQYHRVGDLPGCYAPTLVDLDGDGDQDIATVSGFNNWRDPNAVSLMAWLNDGSQNFTRVPLATSPTHLITLAAGDLDGDGVPELVTGGFHMYPPWDRLSRVTLWKRQ